MPKRKLLLGNSNSEAVLIAKYTFSTANDTLPNFEDICKLTISSTITVQGKVVETKNAKQPFEVHAKEVLMLGDCPENYPIQPKRHTREFLREVAHLRPRTNLFSAVFRIRSVAAMAIHTYFQENGYLYVVYAYGNESFTSETDVVIFR